MVKQERLTKGKTPSVKNLKESDPKKPPIILLKNPSLKKKLPTTKGKNVTTDKNREVIPKQKSNEPHPRIYKSFRKTANTEIQKYTRSKKLRRTRAQKQKRAREQRYLQQIEHEYKLITNKRQTSFVKQRTSSSASPKIPSLSKVFLPWISTQKLKLIKEAIVRIETELSQDSACFYLEKTGELSREFAEDFMEGTTSEVAEEVEETIVEPNSPDTAQEK